MLLRLSLPNFHRLALLFRLLLPLLLLLVLGHLLLSINLHIGHLTAFLRHHSLGFPLVLFLHPGLVYQLLLLA